MDSAEKIRILKQIFEAKTDEELAEKLEIGSKGIICQKNMSYFWCKRWGIAFQITQIP